ncbi:ABC transporter ATP-binding protein/permease [bacterium]|nr:ABC transporter ATP-binding protein/permease [bacterium]
MTSEYFHKDSIIGALQRLLPHISNKRKYQLIILLALMIVSAFSEILTISIALPFFSALGSSTQDIENSKLLQNLHLNIDLLSSQQILLSIAVIFVVTILLSSTIRLANLWLNLQLVSRIGSDISCKAYKKTLYQSYSAHVSMNTSKIITVVTSRVGKVVQLLNNLLSMISSAFVILGVVIALYMTDAFITTMAIALFTLTYIYTGIKTKKRFTLNGQKIMLKTQQQVQFIQEGMGSIRDIILDSNHDYYADVYEKVDQPLRRAVASNNYLASFPRYVIEGMTLTFITVIAIIAANGKAESSNILPLLGTIALGSQKLLPAFHQTYASWASLRGGLPSFLAVLELLEQSYDQNVINENSKALLSIGHDSTIEIKNLYFQYSESQPFVIKDLCLKLRSGTKIGIIGPTGSGKSTFIDIFMGLLRPSRGQILIDGKDIYNDENFGFITSLRNSIAHVPQTIYLADTTIEENIAFGKKREDIDFELVRKVATQAQVSDFINSLPQGYNSIVGEGGTLLSGGQRQLIGLARALYKESQIIVLDEATSALDDNTEKSIMEVINNLDNNRMILIVAHRLTTVMKCDRILKIEDGIIVGDGPPSILLAGKQYPI